jgi:hypothetical protein
LRKAFFTVETFTDDGEKVISIQKLFCPPFWDSACFFQGVMVPIKGGPFWGWKIMEWSPNFFCGLVTCINGIFKKNIGKNWSILPSALAKRKFQCIYGVATTN